MAALWEKKKAFRKADTFGSVRGYSYQSEMKLTRDWFQDNNVSDKTTAQLQQVCKRAT